MASELETVGVLGTGGLIAVTLQAAAKFIRETWGDPKARMKHLEKLEQVEGQTEVAIAQAQAQKAGSQAVATEAESRVSSAAVTALAQRCEAMEGNLATVHRLLDQQTQRIDFLSSTNANLVEKVTKLKERVSHLESQAATDAATIADLQRQLSEARSQLANAQASLDEWMARCGACDGRAEPPAVQFGPEAKSKPASKKGKRK
jgi:chromosome segregation ATPase